MKNTGKQEGGGVLNPALPDVCPVGVNYVAIDDESLHDHCSDIRPSGCRHVHVSTVSNFWPVMLFS